MAIIKPFRALRYNEKKVGPLARVVAPPYDVIDREEQDALYRQSPHNSVRLILSRDSERYSSAASLFSRWIEEAVLVPDPTPAIYLYTVRFHLPAGSLLPNADSGEFERVGILAALRLEEYATGMVRPHERTFSGPKSDRLSLLRACKANLSPIFGLFSKERLKLSGFRPSSPPIAEADLGELGYHRLWRIDDPATISHLAELLRDEPVLIADGHHRYETALRYRAEKLELQDAGESNDPANYIMAYLANMDEAGLVVLSTHRLLKQTRIGLAQLKQRLASWAQVTDLESSDTGFAEMKDRLSRAGEENCTIGIVTEKGTALWLLNADWSSVPIRRELAEGLERLQVTALHEAVLPAALGLEAGSSHELPGLSFEKDADRARGRVASGEIEAAFLLPPPSLEGLKEVCKVGVTMPEKSTYFFPKLLTGLVFRSLDERYV